MTRLTLPYIHRFRDRRGVVRHYFRRHGQRVALPGAPGSAEFMAAYQQALEGVTPAEPGKSREVPGSFSALVAEYYKSAAFRGLAEETKRTYRNIIERFRATHGTKPVALLEARHVRKMVDERADTPAAANGLLKMLKVLMRHAVEYGWRKDDPTAAVRRLKYRSAGHTTWSEADIAAFEKKHPSGTRARLALALLLYTGARRSDAVRFGRQHVQGDRIEWRQGKTGATVSLPIHPDLRAELAALPRDQLTFLVTRDGVPFTSTGFYNWFSECAKEAGLQKGLSPHGLRKSCATRLADAGASPHEIMAVTGHTSLKEVERYTRDANKRKLADGAIALLKPKA
jgi:integrase